MSSRLSRIIRSPWATIAALFLAVGLVVYAYSVFVNMFIEFDDTLLIIDNISVIEAGRWSSVAWAFANYDPELYIPLTFLSFQLDAVIGGLHPFIFHLDNLAEHIVNALLIAGILQMLFRRLDIAVLLGLLFLVHPLNTEAVAWASGRKDLLSSLFALASLLAYLLYREDDRVRFLRISVGLFVLGLLAKISVVPLPLVLLLLDYGAHGRIGIRDLWEKTWFFIAAIPFGLLALLGKDSVLARSSTANILLLIPRSILFYLEKLILPLRLSIFYPFPENAIRLATPSIAIAIIVVAAACAALVRYRRRAPGVVLGSCVALLFLIPSFLQYYRGVEFYIATDRYMYMPFLGVLIALASVLVLVPERRRRLMHGICFAVLVACAALSFQRSLVWRNTGTLFSNALETSESFLSYEKVGTWELRIGDRAKAIEALRRSIEISPNSAAYFRLGVAAMEEGNTADAKLFMQEAIKLSPDYSDPYVNMGKMYWEEGSTSLAIENTEKGVELHPWDMMALGNLATMYTLSGRKDDALRIIQMIRDIDPDNARVKPLLRKLGL